MSGKANYITVITHFIPNCKKGLIGCLAECLDSRRRILPYKSSLYYFKSVHRLQKKEKYGNSYEFVTALVASVAVASQR